MAGITAIERERRDALYGQGLKRCTRCGEALPVASFALKRGGYRGLSGTCRLCSNAATSDHQRRHPEQVANRVRRWCGANVDRAHQIAKQYRDTHPLEERLRAGRFRAAERGLPSADITSQELLADWNRRGIDPDLCIYTGQPLEVGWHIDHTDPLSRQGSSGHVVTNLVPCNRGANASKGRKHWVDYLADRQGEV